MQTFAQYLPPLALVPRGFTEDDILFLFWALLGFFLLAALTPALLYLNHRVEIWRGRRRDREYTEELVKRAVKEGRRVAEKEALDQSDKTP